ncbi:MAG: hypothetical protein M1828_003765 [Chrysothrix sp. TS-e1954]|nr:MAG: hypothetical protein M1828_003765 [Chrysothrix sp. TS-e1954]
MADHGNADDAGLHEHQSVSRTSDPSFASSEEQSNGNDVSPFDKLEPPSDSSEQAMQGRAESPRRRSEHAQRVRFSSDATRQNSGLRISGTATASNDDQIVTDGLLERRAGTTNMTIDIPAVRDESDAESKISQTSDTQAARTTSSTLLSSSSPRGRARGESLRRSLFNRSIRRQATPHGTSINTRATDPLDGQASSQVTPSESKKSYDAVILDSATLARSSWSNHPETKECASSRPRNYYTLRDGVERSIRQFALFKYLRHIKGLYRRARKIVLHIHDIPPSKDGRHLNIDASTKKPLIDERTRKAHISNTISSTRYNAWNFVPRQLFAQFSKLANFYFLCVSILQLIPGLSTTGTYTTIVPLLIFVTIAIAREGWDDLRRHRLDKEENAREISVLHSYLSGSQTAKDSSKSPGLTQWASVKSAGIQVGDIVKLRRNETVPADLLLLHTPKQKAYVETMALDGETNLKSKQAPQCLAGLCNTPEKLSKCSAEIVVEDPNPDLYNFEGHITVGTETLSLTMSEVIYRGSIIRNTTEVFGFVVYSGEECKIRMNASKNARIKAPSLQSIVNRIVILIVFFVVALSIYNSVAYEIWNSFEDRAWYLDESSVSFGQVIVSFIIMFNTMIPLSLYVSLEIIKFCQRYLLDDIDMYHVESNTAMEARTSTINEELGQISYVFSDKTGTLTENSMKFRKLSVAGTTWLHDTDLSEPAIKSIYRERAARDSKAKGTKSAVDARHSDMRMSLSSPAVPNANLVSPASGEAIPSWKSSVHPDKNQLELRTTEMLMYIQRKPHTVFAQKARFVLICVALCHTCVPETTNEGSVNYQAASPDELALVEAAQQLGFMVVDRTADAISIRMFSSSKNDEHYVEKYEILDIIEFSSNRKRMSIIVKFPDKRICVISKGADSTMMPLFRLSSLASQCMTEINERSSQRKNREASIAIARRSEQSALRSPHGPFGRASLALQRSSFGDVNRPSFGSPKTLSTRQQQSGCPAGGERVSSGFFETNTSAQSPRVSTHMGRHSTAASEGRSSTFLDDGFELVDEAMLQDDGFVLKQCLQHVDEFSAEGLRTLLYGCRFVPEEEYDTWSATYRTATTSISDRQASIEKAAELIERGLELVGATAIEDKLQEGVPETIDKLRRANIKIWMLTGDKRETAINIGHACRLIKDYSTITVLDHRTGRVAKEIANMLAETEHNTIAHSVVVIDGETLTNIDNDRLLHPAFLSLAIVADTLICCRASPAQKASLVKAIRRKVRHSSTLAIGDGANDIAMIQEAHVGIGITGKEGLQAARTSDYSIAQFRFLSKLLLVHGRWNYIRTCKYVLATFWKEMMFYLTQALYQRSTGYTGTSLQESWNLTVWNTLFTSLPVIFLGIFEQDLSAATLIAVPELYAKGQRNGGFNYKLYLWWTFIAVADAMIIYFLALRLFAEPEREYTDVYPFGDLIYVAAVTFVTIKLLFFEMHTKSTANAIAAFLSVGGLFLWMIIMNCIYSDNVEYDVKHAFLERFGHDGAWWMALLLILCALSVIEVGLRVVKAAYFPSDTDVFQGLEKDPDMRRSFENAARLELQQGWNHDGSPQGKSCDEPEGGTEERRREEAEQARREDEVADMLRLRAQGHAVEMSEKLAPPKSGDDDDRNEGEPNRRARWMRDILTKRLHR